MYSHRRLANRRNRPLNVAAIYKPVFIAVPLPASPLLAPGPMPSSPIGPY